MARAMGADAQSSSSCWFPSADSAMRPIPSTGAGGTACEAATVCGCVGAPAGSIDPADAAASTVSVPAANQDGIASLRLGGARSGGDICILGLCILGLLLLTVSGPP